MRLDFTNTSMSFIIETLQELLETQDIISFTTINPDIASAQNNTQTIIYNNRHYIYRSYKAWTSLAEILFCTMKTPKILDNNCVEIILVKLDTQNSFHTKTVEKEKEKYGVDSSFFEIDKMQEPSFIHYYKEALKNVKVEDRKNILNLGINGGDEFQVIKDILDIKKYDTLNLLGIDYSQTAIEHAQSRFSENNVSLLAHDINDIDSLNLEPHDLIITIGTLQSASHNFKTYFMHLIQNYLKKDGAIILGFPNCRWIENEMIYGAKAPNYPYSEQSILYNDVMFCKKYLQQKKFRVTLTGKEYLFLTATSFNKNQ